MKVPYEKTITVRIEFFQTFFLILKIFFNEKYIKKIKNEILKNKKIYEKKIKFQKIFFNFLLRLVSNLKRTYHEKSSYVYLLQR